MVDCENEKTPRVVSGSASGSRGWDIFDYYQQRGRYRICWTGPAHDLVYSAWLGVSRDDWQLLGCFKHGTDDKRKAAAEQCCRENWGTRAAK